MHLDNIVLDAQTSAMETHQMSIVTNLLKSLGFTLNQKKCILTPSQNPEFLGFQEDTTTMTQTTDDLEGMSSLSLDTKDLSKI